MTNDKIMASFDKKFGYLQVNSAVRFDDIKSFLLSALSEKDKEWENRIKKMCEEGKKNLITANNGHGFCNPRCHDSGKEEVLDSIINQLIEK